MLSNLLKEYAKEYHHLKVESPLKPFKFYLKNFTDVEDELKSSGMPLKQS